MEPEETLTTAECIAKVMDEQLNRLLNEDLNDREEQACVKTILTCGQLLNDDQKIGIDSYKSEEDRKWDREKTEINDALERAKIDLELERLDFEKSKTTKQFWLDVAKVGVEIGLFAASMIFTSCYYTKQAIYETTGDTRTAFGRSALKLAEPFQKKLGRFTNN